MKRGITLLLITLMSVSAFSYDIEVEGLTYNLKKVDDEIYAELAGRAYAVDPNGYMTYKTDVIIPSEVTYGARTYTVKGIGPCAFAPDISGNYAMGKKGIVYIYCQQK